VLYFDFHELYQIYCQKKPPSKLGTTRYSLLQIFQVAIKYDPTFAQKIPSSTWSDIVFSFFALKSNTIYHNIVYDMIRSSFALKSDMLHLKIIIDNNLLEKLHNIVKEAQFANDTHQVYPYKDYLVSANEWISLIMKYQNAPELPMFREQLSQSEAWTSLMIMKGEKKLLKLGTSIFKPPSNQKSKR
jgi:hypothetical protein